MTSTNQYDRPMTVKEAAEYLSLSPLQVRLYIKDKVLPAHKIGNGKAAHWRIWRQDLIAFVNNDLNVR